jgi:Carbohydrate family 9 binding domain-like
MYRVGAPSSLWGAAIFCALSAAACAKKPPELSRLESSSLPKDLTPLGQVFGGVVELVGAQIVSPPQAVKPGGRVEVKLVWRKLGAVPRGFRLFTHVLDEAGERILNLDATGALRKTEREEPLYPPSLWEEGKLYVDELAFFVPSAVRTDTIRIVCGVYRGKERLRLSSGSSPEATRATALRLNVTLPPQPGAGTVPSLWVPFRRAPIVLDGKLDEEAWATAGVAGPFVNVATGRPITGADVGARAKLLYDDEALYIGVDVVDEDLRGGFDRSQRDPHLWTEDTIEVMVDPDGDGDNLDYYEIQVGPQNLVFDSVFDSYNQPRVAPDGPFGHQEWSSQLKSAVTVRGTLDDQASDDGYTVELAIPWSSFDRAKRTPPAPADVWRLNLYALDSSGSASAWSPILGQGNFHKAARFARVRFLAKPRAAP